MSISNRQAIKMLMGDLSGVAEVINEINAQKEILRNVQQEFVKKTGKGHQILVGFLIDLDLYSAECYKKLDELTPKKITKVLSARVPMELHELITTQAKQMGMTKSAYLSELVKSRINGESTSEDSDKKD